MRLKTVLPIFLFLFLLTPALFAKDYLQYRIRPTDKRYATFKTCFMLLKQRGAQMLVETGTSRCGARNCAGDGCSTILFADWAKDHGATLFSVDIDPKAVASSKAAARAYLPYVQFVTGDSVTFLQNFNQKIDFLYLDSYDFDEKDPKPSQMHHLKEIQAALPYLHKESIVMIDDCKLPHGGKGKLAIAFLLDKGWKIYFSGYQVILVQ